MIGQVTLSGQVLDHKLRLTSALQILMSAISLILIPTTSGFSIQSFSYAKKWRWLNWSNLPVRSGILTGIGLTLTSLVLSMILYNFNGDPCVSLADRKVGIRIVAGLILMAGSISGGIMLYYGYDLLSAVAKAKKGEMKRAKGGILKRYRSRSNTTADQRIIIWGWICAGLFMMVVAFLTIPQLLRPVNVVCTEFSETEPMPNKFITNLRQKYPETDQSKLGNQKGVQSDIGIPHPDQSKHEAEDGIRSESTTLETTQSEPMETSQPESAENLQSEPDTPKTDQTIMNPKDWENHTHETLRSFLMHHQNDLGYDLDEGEVESDSVAKGEQLNYRILETVNHRETSIEFGFRSIPLEGTEKPEETVQKQTKLAKLEESESEILNQDESISTITALAEKETTTTGKDVAEESEQQTLDETEKNEEKEVDEEIGTHSDLSHEKKTGSSSPMEDDWNFLDDELTGGFEEEDNELSAIEKESSGIPNDDAVLEEHQFRSPIHSSSTHDSLQVETDDSPRWKNDSTRSEENSALTNKDSALIWKDSIRSGDDELNEWITPNAEYEARRKRSQLE